MGPEVISSDICIIGTGAAGGILAYELAKAGLKVVSLEQGGPIEKNYFTNEKNPEDIDNFGISPQMPWALPLDNSYYYDNREAGNLYATDADLSTSMRSKEGFINRQVFRINGKQNLWGGVSLRMSERDFKGRQYKDSNFDWPLSYDILSPHYDAVERLITVCGNTDGLENLPDGIFIPPKPLRPADVLLMNGLKKIKQYRIRAIQNRKAVETRKESSYACKSCGMCIYGCNAASVYKFSTRLLPEIVKLSNYHILYHSKVIKLIRDAGDAIREVVCVDTETRQERRVNSKIFILCAGALETPRILFNSHDETFTRGLANRSGLVGAYLQDNVKVLVCTSLIKLLGRQKPYDVGYGDNLLIPRFIFDHTNFRGGFQAQFLHSVIKRPHYLRALNYLPHWTHERLARGLFYTYAALAMMGAPEVVKTNCLAPSEEKDEYGVPRVDVFYKWTENDRNMQKEMQTIGSRIFRKASGYFQQCYIGDIPGNAIHYAGTCRMGKNASEGVVDENLQSFDHKNLYICDGSVFPTLSEKNMTLTIMALAHRLAKTLKRK